MAIEQIKDLMGKKIITQVLPLDSEKITNMTEEELIEYGYITQVTSTTPTIEPEGTPDTPNEEPTTEPVIETPTEEPTIEPDEEPVVEPEEDDSPVVEEEE